MTVLRERIVNRLGGGLIGFRPGRVRGANKRNLLCVVIKCVSLERLLLLPRAATPSPPRVSTFCSDTVPSYRNENSSRKKADRLY